MGKYIKDSILYTVYLFGASLLSLLTSAIPLYITKALTGNEYIQTLIMAIGMIISMIITMYIILYQTGYRKNSGQESYKNSEILITVSSTTALHFIIALLSKFFSFLYLPIAYIGGLIIGDTYIDTIATLVNTHFHIMILSYFLMMIPLLVSIIFGFNNGFRKRQKEREKTISGK
jgi:hypothetical protein